jgi:excisionase family DNA binding protein
MKGKNIEKQAFNRKEAAAYMGLAENTFINKLVKTNRIKYIQVGRRCIFPKKELDKFLESGGR